MGAVGELSIMLNVLVFIAGILVAGSIFSIIFYIEVPIFNISTMIVLFAYLFFSFIIVFTPLYITHNNMRKARDRILNLVDYEFETVNKSLLQKLNSSEQNDYHAGNREDRRNPQPV